MIVLILLLQAALPAGRTYDLIPLEQLSRGTKHTHVCTIGPVVYKRKQKDGDWHITLARGDRKVVLEIIPTLPLAIPQKGTTIKACGIQRRDGDHSWPEIHPVERWELVPQTPTAPKVTK